MPCSGVFGGGGTPCTPPPQKGGELRFHQMNRSGLAGGYLMNPFDDERDFRTKVESEETR